MATKMEDNSFQIFVSLLDSSVPMYFPVRGTPNTCVRVTRGYLGNLPLFPNTIPPLALQFWEKLFVGKAHWASETVKEGGGRNGKV